MQPTAAALGIMNVTDIIASQVLVTLRSAAVAELLRHMSRLPPDAKAFSQGIVFTLLAFVIGAASVFIVVVWLSLVSDPKLEWFEMLRVAVSAWEISLLVGLAAAAGVSVIHSR